MDLVTLGLTLLTRDNLLMSVRLTVLNALNVSVTACVAGGLSSWTDRVIRMCYRLVRWVPLTLLSTPWAPLVG